MKRKTATVWLLTLTALATGLAACGGGEGGSSVASDPTSDTSGSDSSSGDSATSSTSVSIARRILRETLPFFEVSSKIDLDDYISIEYRDGSIDKNYTIETTAEELVIDGHTISSDTIGEYRVDVTAGSLNTRLTIRFTSSELIEIAEFLEPLSTNPDNYTADCYYGGSNYPYYWTNYRAENYSARFDPEDLEKTRSGTNEDGSTYTIDVNNVLAELSDGSYYSGKVVEGATSGSYDVKFTPGKITNAAYYYCMMGISFDSGSLSDSILGNERYVMGSATFTEGLVQGGLGYGFYIGEDYDAQWYGAIVIDKTYGDDGKIDSVTLQALYTEDNQIGSVMIITLRDLGTTKLDWLETAQTNNAYVPIPYTASEISTAYANLAASDNFTVTAKLSQLEEDASEVVNVAEDTDYMYAAYGANTITITNTFTKEGVNSVMTGEPVTIATDGTVTIGTTEQMGGWAAWTDGTKSWRSSYDDEEAAYSARTEIKDADDASTTDVYGDFLDENGFSAAGITAAAASSTNWSSREVSETAHTVTYAGECGDNDGTNQTNLLFMQILNIFGPYASSQGLGTYWTTTREFTSSSGEAETHSYSLYSNYSSFTVNTETNEISAEVVMYAPFSDVERGYILLEYTISNIGTTTNDFSGFPAEADPGTSSSSSSQPAA